MSTKDINVTILSGGLTRDSELQYTQGGYAILKFSIGYTRKKKTGDSWEDKSCYMNCVLFGKLGESIKDYMIKGKKVMVSGELDHQTWEKDGVKRSAHSLIVNDIKMESGGKKEGQNTKPAKPDYDPDEVPF